MTPPPPDALAQAIVSTYAGYAQGGQLPYALSAIDLQRIDPVTNGVDALAVLLTAWVDNDPGTENRVETLEAIRTAAAELVAELEGGAGLPALVLANAAGSNYLPSAYGGGAWVALDNANGISYYPISQLVPAQSRQPASESDDPRFDEIYQAYINDQWLDFTLASRWDGFLRSAVGVPAPDEPLAPPPGPLPVLFPPLPSASSGDGYYLTNT